MCRFATRNLAHPTSITPLPPYTLVTKSFNDPNFSVTVKLSHFPSSSAVLLGRIIFHAFRFTSNSVANRRRLPKETHAHAYICALPNLDHQIPRQYMTSKPPGIGYTLQPMRLLLLVQSRSPRSSTRPLRQRSPSFQ